MAVSDDALETYNHLPIRVDPQTKQVSVSSPDAALQEAVANVNTIHALFKTLETTNNIPPPPVPVNPKRSAQITKLRESAGQSIKKGQYPDALRFCGLAIDMASTRHPWEPVGLLREELATSYVQRANAHVLAQHWVEGWKDAEVSLECKSGPQQGPNGQKGPGNPRAFVLGGRCLIEMARWQEAVTWLERGLEVEGDAGDEGREMKKLLEQARKEADKHR